MTGQGVRITNLGLDLGLGECCGSPDLCLRVQVSSSHPAINRSCPIPGSMVERLGYRLKSVAGTQSMDCISAGSISTGNLLAMQMNELC